ncbi:MAG: hypothetical protein QXD62_03105 [Candidatus Woesearchaeota archaeon]
MNEEEVVKRLSEEFKRRLSVVVSESESYSSPETQKNLIHSYDYLEFKKQFLPKRVSFYEKMCIKAQEILKIKASEQAKQKYQPYLETCHLSIDASHVLSAAILYPTFFLLIFLFIGALYGFVKEDLGAPLFFFVVGLILAGFFYYVLSTYPQYLATLWRIKASNSLVESLFYIVTYLRHTSNLERAIEFAADHLSPPLSLDFKKMLWDVESGKFPSVVDSINHFLDKWKGAEDGYCQAMNLVISSLDEGNEQRRISMLENALNLMLDSSFEKMLKYTHDLQQPVTMIHMVGVILPLMATVMLPLLVSFMEGVKWYHISLLYNLLLPIFLFWQSKKIISMRPSSVGFSSGDFPYQTKNSQVLINSILLALFFILIGLGPATWMKWFFMSEDLSDIVLFEMQGTDLKIQLLSYKAIDNKNIEGPFSFVSAIIGLFVVFGIAYGLGYYYYYTTYNFVKVKENTRKFENELISVLLQLGNRLNEDLPLEVAFKELYENLSDSLESKKFFQIVVYNLENRGMGIEEAIFDSDQGAVRYYPSPLISSIMKILIDASKKGPRIAGAVLITLSDYVKRVNEINRRVTDLLTENLAGMRSIIKFLGPVLNGIVVALSAMISTIILTLKDFLSTKLQDASSQAGGILDMLTTGMPSYYFHIICGIYIVMVVYLLSELITVIENGPDEFLRKYTIGSNLKKVAINYCTLAGLLTFVFCFIAMIVIANSY